MTIIDPHGPGYHYHPPTLADALARVEADILPLDVETLVAFLDDGTEVLRVPGDSSQIVLPPHQAPLVANRVVTHNHPTGLSLTDADVTTAILTNMIEIRAIGKNALGLLNVFVLRRPPNGWPPMESTARIARAINLQVRRELTDGIIAGRIPHEVAVLKLRDIIWERLAQRLSLDYRKYPL